MTKSEDFPLQVITSDVPIAHFFSNPLKPLRSSYGLILSAAKPLLLDFLLAKSESQNAWEGFLWDLYGRGLEGKREGITSTACTFGSPGHWIRLSRQFGQTSFSRVHFFVHAQYEQKVGQAI